MAENKIRPMVVWISELIRMKMTRQMVQDNLSKGEQRTEKKKQQESGRERE